MKLINVGYLPAIRDTPTKYEVVYEILCMSLECKDYLNLEFIFLGVDQAIYNKVIQVKFQLLKENVLQYENVVVRMGGFHMFKGFGFVELLSEVGLGGAGSIENALKGGDRKTGVRDYKLLFEAVYRAKIEKSNVGKETANEEANNINFLNEACENLNVDTVEKMRTFLCYQVLMEICQCGSIRFYRWLIC